MAVNFVQGQVAVSDPTPGGPTALSNIKQSLVKVVKLTSANFSTSNVDTQVAILPADAMITSFSLWIKTQLAGNSISAATIALGNASGGAQFHAATSAFGTAGAYAALGTPLAIYQNYSLPQGNDIPIWVRGVATTGNPTSGEMYLAIHYVR